MNIVPRSTGNTNSGTRELTLKCKFKCYINPWITHWALALVKGNMEPHEAKKKSFDLGGNRTHDLRIRSSVTLTRTKNLCTKQIPRLLIVYVLIYLWACIFQRIYLLLESRKKFVQSRKRISFLRSWLVSFLPFAWSSYLPCSWFVGVFSIVWMLLETFVNFVNFKLFRYIFRELAFTAVNQGQTFIIHHV